MASRRGDTRSGGDGSADVFFSGRKRHTELRRDWSSDGCSSGLPTSGQLRGIRLSRSTRSSRKRRMEMCSWCHHVHKTNGTAMFTVPVRGSEGRHTLGNIVCKNLDCSLRIRKLVQPDSYMRESLYQPAKIWRMQQSMHKWLGRAKQL